MIKTYIRMDTLPQIEKSRNLPTFAHVVSDEGPGGSVVYWLGWFQFKGWGRKARVTFQNEDEGGYRVTEHEKFHERFTPDTFKVYSRFRDLV
jgi:hypothetical protein